MSQVTMVLKPGDDLPIPDMGPFHGIPHFILKSIKVKDTVFNTAYQPKSSSLPSTRHPNIRIIDFDWNGVRVLMEYSTTTGKMKVIKSNVDEMTVIVR